jgi:hypothetical protein
MVRRIARSSPIDSAGDLREVPRSQYMFRYIGSPVMCSADKPTKAAVVACVALRDVNRFSTNVSCRTISSRSTIWPIAKNGDAFRILLGYLRPPIATAPQQADFRSYADVSAPSAQGSILPTHELRFIPKTTGPSFKKNSVVSAALPKARCQRPYDVTTHARLVSPAWISDIAARTVERRWPR